MAAGRGKAEVAPSRFGDKHVVETDPAAAMAQVEVPRPTKTPATRVDEVVMAARAWSIRSLPRCGRCAAQGRTNWADNAAARSSNSMRPAGSGAARKVVDSGSLFGRALCSNSIPCSGETTRPAATRSGEFVADNLRHPIALGAARRRIARLLFSGIERGPDLEQRVEHA